MARNISITRRGLYRRLVPPIANDQDTQAIQAIFSLPTPRHACPQLHILLLPSSTSSLSDATNDNPNSQQAQNETTRIGNHTPKRKRKRRMFRDPRAKNSACGISFHFSLTDNTLSHQHHPILAHPEQPFPESTTQMSDPHLCTSQLGQLSPPVVPEHT